MPSKRPWTRAEKLLWVAPVGLLGAASLLWWRAKTADVFIPLPPKNYSYVAFSPDSKKLSIVRAFNGRILGFFDATSGEKQLDLEQLDGVSDSHNTLGPVWSPSGTHLAYGITNFTPVFSHPKLTNPGIKYPFRKIAIWNTKTGKISSPSFPESSKTTLLSIRYSRDGRHLLADGNPAAIFDAGTGKRLQQFQRFHQFQQRAPYSLEGMISPDESQVVFSTQGDAGAELYDAKSNRVLWQPKADSFSFPFIWSKNEVLGALAMMNINNSAMKGHRVLLWDGKNRQQLDSPPSDDIEQFALSDADSCIAVGESVKYDPADPSGHTQHAKLYVWDYRDKTELWNQTLNGRVMSLSWSPNGEFLAVTEFVRDAYTVWIADSTGRRRYSRRGKVAAFDGWAPDSKHFVVQGEEGLFIGSL